MAIAGLPLFFAINSDALAMYSLAFSVTVTSTLITTFDFYVTSLVRSKYTNANNTNSFPHITFSIKKIKKIKALQEKTKIESIP